MKKLFLSLLSSGLFLGSFLPSVSAQSLSPDGDPWKAYDFDTSMTFEEIHPLLPGWEEFFKIDWKDDHQLKFGNEEGPEPFEFKLNGRVVDIERDKLSDSEMEQYVAAQDAYYAAHPELRDIDAPQKGTERYYHFYHGLTHRLDYILNDMMRYLSAVDSNPVAVDEIPKSINDKNSMKRPTIRLNELREYDGLDFEAKDYNFEQSEAFFNADKSAVKFFALLNESSVHGTQYLDGSGDIHNPGHKERENRRVIGEVASQSVPGLGSTYRITDGPYFEDKRDGITPKIRMIFSYAIDSVDHNGAPYTVEYDNVYIDVTFNGRGRIVSGEFDNRKNRGPVRLTNYWVLPVPEGAQ